MTTVSIPASAKTVTFWTLVSNVSNTISFVLVAEACARLSALSIVDEVTRSAKITLVLGMHPENPIEVAQDLRLWETGSMAEKRTKADKAPAGRPTCEHGVPDLTW